MRLLELPPFLRPSVSLRNKDRLPAKPGVYYALQWWKPLARPLYIGESGDMNARWNSRRYNDHHQLHNLSHRFGVRLHYRVTANKAAAQRLEAIELHRFETVLNKRIEPLRKDRRRDIQDFCVDVLILGLAFSTIGIAVIAVIKRLHGAS